MNRIVKVSFLLLATVSCDDVLMRDISDDTIVLNSPVDGYETSVKKVVFWWERLEGATSYELVVASHDITNPQVLLLDTVITRNQLSVTLPADSVQWCVRGISTDYRTAYACRILKIK